MQNVNHNGDGRKVHGNIEHSAQFFCKSTSALKHNIFLIKTNLGRGGRLTWGGGSDLKGRPLS